MSNLVLDSLEIKNFRAFKHLRIEHLGRVNLIVGKNNVGKSSLLEALWLYAVKGEPEILFQLLRERDEWRVLNDEPYSLAAIEDRLSALKYLFFGRKDLNYNQEQITIGSVAFEYDLLKIGIAPSEWLDTGLGHTQLRLLGPEDQAASSNLLPSLTIDIGNTIHYHFPLDKDYTSRFFRDRMGVGQFHSVIVTDDGLTAKDTALYWDNIVLSDLQNDVIAALQIIAPGATNINLIGAKNGGNGRVPIVKMQDFFLPIPLRSMGEGMNRLFGIALALVNAKDGMLLIDEVDTGLHYSVLPDVWKLIFEVAHRLNVQVFATTHSWDCIQAFQQAADDNKDEEGVLIRLENREGDVSPVVFDERKLNIATREQIEVR